MTTKEQAEQAVRDAMKRWGITASEMGHKAGKDCWCSPEIRCQRCGLGSCGCGEAFVFFHRRAC